MKFINYAMFEQCVQLLEKTHRTDTISQIINQATSSKVAERYVPEVLWRRLLSEINRMNVIPEDLPSFDFLISIIPEYACAANCPNGQIAIETYIKYQWLVGTADSYHIIPTAAGTLIEYIPDDYDHHGIHSALSNFSIISSLIQGLYGLNKLPATWSFPYNKVSKRLNELIDGHIENNQNTCTLFIPSTYLVTPSPYFNPNVSNALITLAESQLEKIQLPPAPHQFTQKVIEHLRVQYSNEQLDNSLDTICKKQHCSRWTLNRNLKKEGTTYQNLLAQFRDEKSKELFGEANISMQEIAFRLGFSTQSSLNRHIKNRFDCTPKTLREKLLLNNRQF
ncbi:helix-turn-helix transcriptional regulator [Photobacterium satsumensis]|uniref:helix-turn-helix transcriptional regulator n=1 Tax=Photobacterium satsumensis TaxID=2910239 RepID=UPI003D11247C